MHCGGNPGAIRCDSAIITKVYPEGSATNPWEPGYDLAEYDLLCPCGEFGLAANHVEDIEEID